MAIEPPTPITILTGFLGSGKTTLLLNLLPQLPSDYRLALLKNEFGDIAIDSQLASEQSISGVRELLNGCICCNLVGQLDSALTQLRTEIKPDRIIIETSGSAFPATLAMEITRLATENESTKGHFVLDGVISVIDVENWQGYEDTSYTAKMQARYTDLIVFNKWELVDERRFDVCLDRLGDLELDSPTPWVKSDRGRVERDVLLGIDGALLAKEGGHIEHEHDHDHQSEVEVLSLTLPSHDDSAVLDLPKFTSLLKSTSKEEVYRIKGTILCSSSQIPQNSDPTFLTTSFTGTYTSESKTKRMYILNWAFGRWTFTPTSAEGGTDVVARLTFILARYESVKWKRKLETGEYVAVEGSADNKAKVENGNYQHELLGGNNPQLF
ncbi:CobW domain protein [Talaromyces stipitatus ATCC 10500]|uniref:CobW domain protein n=1 Tax=Talaromyces stipitatus (strain ATCC 10500 / CBS 375.48 / QM 6759 / NRRL 1006) TaxID=441959 RepID=B8MJK7_TALSN|nr:CobW domain protein [Talaromyces stipitatus ATCC 10500]EED15207.1 CobW domain protein [Talaromyces stipitatus ATCC 10500]